MEPFLSVIIPAHNEERRLPKTLEQVLAYLEHQPYTAEVLVVENGSQDATFEIAQDFARRHASLRALQVSARGKGLAVRHGMLAASGAYRFLCDADLSMPIEELAHFLPPQLEGYDIAIASREAPGAVRYGEPAYRHFVGRVFNHLVRWLAVPGFHDTQCGFKCFRGEVAEDLFAVQRLTGLGFDVEVLFIAQRRGYRIAEVPIPWYFDPDSRVRLVRDSLAMFADILRVHWNWRKGVYEPRG